MKKGKIFVLEGADGTGKTTIGKEVATRLLSEGIKCEYFSFPGREDGTLGSLIYKLHHDKGRFNVKYICPESLQLLHIAAHIDQISNDIFIKLNKSKNIILDRYWWSTWVYGVCSGIDKVFLESAIELERIFWGDYKPAIAFHIMRKRPIGTLYNKKWKNLVTEYRRLAETESSKYLVETVSNDLKIENAINRVLNLIMDSLNITTIGEKKEKGTKKQRRTPIVFSKLLPLKATVVYDTYWKFAAERQNVFMRRFLKENPPWTKDPIIKKFKFTNTYRAADRVSQYLIRNVIYKGDQSIEDLFFRIILFKIFNRISTWQILEEKLGDITYKSFTIKVYDRILSNALKSGKKIYSAAYIMPSGGRNGRKRKHRMHLELLNLMMYDRVPAKISECKSMGKAFDILRSYPTIGDFLAYQYITDINYSICTDFSEMEFVVPGPGAKGGIHKCFSDLGGLTENEIIKVVTERQEIEFKKRGIKFTNLFGRPLQLIDCQNLFCEVDKYSREKHPYFTCSTGRKKIKQKFQMNPTTINYMFPPKWGIKM